MSIVLGVLTFFIGLYALLMLLILIGWVKRNNRRISNSIKAKGYSVIIPFRNESKNIPNLILSLSNLNYPKDKVEFLFIDDNSNDNSSNLLKDELKYFPYEYQLLALTDDKKGKKEAINLGVKKANNEWLITTDVDCIHPEMWLEEINCSNENQFKFGAVLNVEKKGLLFRLQEIESLMLLGVSMGAAELKTPVLCSGANLVYSKSIFETLKPYESNITIASGDDMFFLKSAIKNNITIGTTNSTVLTQPAETIKELFYRSIRWAGKTNKLKNLSTTIFGAVVLASNYSILILMLMLFLWNDGIEIFIKLCGVKVLIDVLFLVIIAIHYKRYRVILYSPIMVIIYPLYLLLVSVGGLLYTPKWKGR